MKMTLFNESYTVVLLHLKVEQFSVSYCSESRDGLSEQFFECWKKVFYPIDYRL